MLQVKDLRKEYGTKNGVVTKALDGVTLNFPETGMVFLLGKSGSGKSTLLNLCGGLDKADAGEIVINGKSSKEFTAKDFDSYRNTFVGFIFQEYNVLDEYTVAENVALALELQGKKRGHDEIAQILEEVELKELAARKANTLSGGQKQRVAIARALVKKPQIILADEPTGALDSETGTQIFELLKKLSESRLVLVVSHDRDFAEQYAERIIELKDGKVCADTVRTETGAFEKIEAQPEPRKQEKPAFVRARLPFRHVLRMGFGNLKNKPVRLAFSIILCIFAFVLLGLSSTLMFYSEQSVIAETIHLGKGNYVSIEKEFEVARTYYHDGIAQSNSSILHGYTGFTLKEYEQFKKKFPGALATIYAAEEPINFQLSTDWRMTTYYGYTPDHFVMSDPSLKVLAGKLPTASDEIALPEFLFNAMKLDSTKFVLVTDADVAAGEVSENAPKHVVQTYDDVLYSENNPATIFVNMREQKTFNFKIVGVYKNDKEFYPTLKWAVDHGENLMKFSHEEDEWKKLLSYGFYNYFALSPSFFTEYSQLLERKPYCHSDEGYDYVDRTNYPLTQGYIFGRIIFRHNRNAITLNRIAGLAYEKHADDSYFTVKHPIADEFSSGRLDTTITTFRNVFLYVGLGLAVFAFLLMFNLISVSIITKKKEIGILRALGARSLDVFVLFFVEALMIALVSTAAAMVFSAIVCQILNITMISTIEAAIFVFGVLSAVFILLIAVFTAFLATLIPVVNYTKKSPVESIRTP